MTSNTVAILQRPHVVDGRAVRRLLRLLPGHERDRFEKIGGRRRAESFLLGRVLARHCLGAVLDMPPISVPIRSAPNRKPSLPPGHDLSFAHSRSHVMVAVTGDGHVGVDVQEHIPFDTPLARRVLTAGEFHRIGDLPASKRSSAFASAWTVKEACSKVSGGYLFRGFKRFVAGEGRTGSTAGLQWFRLDLAKAAAAVAYDFRPGSFPRITNVGIDQLLVP